MSSTPVEKYFISAQQLLEDSFALGQVIIEDGFRPNFIVGVWRGGTPVGIAVQELLDYFNIETDHIAIRTSSYTGVDQRAEKVRVHGLGYMTRLMNSEDRLLIVDDVFDTGLSVQAILDALSKRSRKNLPEDIRVATAYYKPSRNQTGRNPDYYVHRTEQWLVFPHELDGMSRDDIGLHKPFLLETVDSIGKSLARQTLPEN